MYIHTGRPNKNEAVACCFSSATALYFWDTLHILCILKIIIFGATLSYAIPFGSEVTKNFEFQQDQKSIDAI